MNDKIITFSVPQESIDMTPEEIENSQFTKVHFRIYSADRVNDHNYTCSLKVLKKYAKTIAGKPILVWYNKYANNGHGDFAGHEDSVYAKEYPVGFFPNDVKITYEKDENGTIFLCADGYIWKLYYSEIVNVFENYGGIKGVSSEMLIIDSEMIEDTNIENILQYSFSALTLIGEHDAIGNKIKPAVDGCQGVLVTNSTTNEEYKKAKVEFEKILYSSKSEESDKTDSFFNTKNKEEIMEVDITKNSTSPDVIENATQEVITKVEVSTDTYSYDDDGKFVGASHEEHTVRTTEVNELPENEIEKSKEPVVDNASEDVEDKKNNDTEIVENSDCEDAEKSVENVCKTENSSNVTKEEFEALKLKCASLEQELSSKKLDYENLMQKCSVLEEYKNNKENENMKNTIEVALNSVSHILNTEQIREWRKKSEECTYETVDNFTNKLKAFAFDVQEKNGIVQLDSIRNSIPKNQENDSMDFWERMDKKYN